MNEVVVNEVDVHVGARLRRQRMAQAISLERLAGLTGINATSLAACEAGTRHASAEELMMLCRTLEVRPADIFEGYMAGTRTS